MGLQQIYLQHTTGMLREEEYQSVVEMLQINLLQTIIFVQDLIAGKVGYHVVYLK